MNQKDPQPNDEGDHAAGDGQQHQPAQNAQRIQKLAIIVPADYARVYRPFVHLHPCEFAIQLHSTTDPTGASATAKIARSTIK
jgi:hypothetical protein